MIKVQATLIGAITKQATIRQDKEGRTQISITILVPVPGSKNNMQGKNIYVSVSKFGTESDSRKYTPGQRIEVSGSLTTKKSKDNIYFNMHADSITFNPTSEKSGIQGILDFKGTIGKSIEEKVDKQGKDYLRFSAYSTEKTPDGFEYTWIRFLKFKYKKMSFVQVGAKVHLTGMFVVTSYNGRLNFDCLIDEINPWAKQPISENNSKNEDLPF